MTTPRWQRVGQLVAREGYFGGLRYPSLAVTLQGSPLTPLQLTQLDRLWVQEWPSLEPIRSASPPPALPPTPWGETVRAILMAQQRLQNQLGWPLEQCGQVVVLHPPQVRLVIPTWQRTQGALLPLLDGVLELFNRLQQGEPLSLERLRALVQQFQISGSSNPPRFLRAAAELGIPVQELPSSILQLGYGAKGRRLDSSFTDTTPHLAVKLARHKGECAALLAQWGLPVPPHRLVQSAAEARQVAEQLGYPVVVKPADLDGGIAVAAELLTAAEVNAAFITARRYSTQILVEKHIVGRDYRLTVFQGELIGAVERVVASVVGDGVQSVAELIAEVNRDPRRGEGSHALLKRLVLDEEARQLLQRHGLTAAAVPPLGYRVPLRRRANISSGGVPVAVLDRVHPDNRRLAVRAAAALQLDLAGVDLLIEDISVSWQQSGGAICEVNGQPQIGGVTSVHLYPQILQRLVVGDGRIPIVVVVGDSAAHGLVAELGQQLRQRGIAAGWYDHEGVWLPSEATALSGDWDFFRAGRLLLRDRSVAMVLMSLHETTPLQRGLPFDRFDELVVADLTLNPIEKRANSSARMLPNLFTTLLLPACRGAVRVLQEAGAIPKPVGWGGEWRTGVERHQLFAQLERQLQL